MSRHRSAALIVALAFGLVGCGGGDDRLSDDEATYAHSLDHFCSRLLDSEQRYHDRAAIPKLPQAVALNRLQGQFDDVVANVAGDIAAFHRVTVPSSVPADTAAQIRADTARFADRLVAASRRLREVETLHQGTAFVARVGDPVAGIGQTLRAVPDRFAAAAPSCQRLPGAVGRSS